MDEELAYLVGQYIYNQYYAYQTEEYDVWFEERRREILDEISDYTQGTHKFILKMADEIRHIKGLHDLNKIEQKMRDAVK